MKDNIPPEWEVQKLSNPLITKLIKAGGTPKRGNPEYWTNGTIPFVKINDITNGSKFLTKTEEKITKKGLDNSSAWIVEPDSILYSMYASYGEPIITKIPVATNQAIIALQPSNINLDYLYYSLLNIKQNLFKYIRESTQKNLNANIVKNLELPIPPLVEQRGIVEVLGTVDECIRLTDAVIERAEELKRGLMQRLLTKGIGHTEYKTTSLGEIPRSWKIKRLQDISKITGGSTPSTTNRDYWGGDIPFVTPSDITSLENENYIFKTRRNITKKALSSTSSSLLDPQTILLTSRATLGEAAINLIPVSTNQGFANIKPDSNVDVFWLFWYLRSKKREFERLASGSTFKEVSRKSVKRMKISLPPLNEQSRIAMIFLSMHEKIKSEYEKSRYFRLIKQGLMQQLLTGKIRVELKGDELQRVRYC